LLRVFALGCALGCASYKGTAQSISPRALLDQAGWNRVDRVELVRQKGILDCGSSALSMVLRYWEPNAGRAVHREAIEDALRRHPGEGLSARDLRDYARRRGFLAFVIKGSFSDLEHEIDVGRPVIVGVLKQLSSGEALAHYEVFIGYHPQKHLVLTLDPANGLRQNTLEAFSTEWQQAGHVTLVVIPSGSVTKRSSAGQADVRVRAAVPAPGTPVEARNPPWW
jgi:ABC-type bacteriocin/lantibiotic exporter with double-glycine peptidase domain